MIPGHDWQNAEIHVTCLPVELVPQLPPCRKNGDHVAADDAVIQVILGKASECPGQVSERDEAKVVGN